MVTSAVPSYDALLRRTYAARLPEIDVAGLDDAQRRHARHHRLPRGRRVRRRARSPSAVWIPRGFLESKIEKHVPDRAAPIVVYCASGMRSLFAARTLAELGYTNVRSLAGGFTGLEERRPAVGARRTRCAPIRRRATRATCCCPRSALAGQLKLLAAKVAVHRRGWARLAVEHVPRGGRRRHARHDRRRRRRRVEPAAPDPARHRSPRHRRRSTAPRRTLQEPQPRRRRSTSTARGSPSATRSSCSARYDVIIDGADNFATRYLVNDVALKLGKPVIHASIFRFEGQLTVFPANGSPCYRCLYPAAAAARGRAVVRRRRRARRAARRRWASLQATEAIKLVLGLGDIARRPAARLRRARRRGSASSSCAAIRSARPAATASIARRSSSSTTSSSAPAPRAMSYNSQALVIAAGQTDRQLPHPEQDRDGRHGSRLSRRAPADRQEGRAQGHPPRARRRTARSSSGSSRRRRRSTRSATSTSSRSTTSA